MDQRNPYEEPGETPLERAARQEADTVNGTSEAAQEEHEADVVIGDIEAYVAETDPASLPQAEAELNAWQIPEDPLEGVPDDRIVDPEAANQPLVAVFAAQSESEANIVRGLLADAGIAAIFDSVPSTTFGTIQIPRDARWGDVLVAPAQAELARATIAAATEASSSERPMGE